MTFKPFYCISYYEGDLSWVELLPHDQYIVYAKSDINNVKINNIQKKTNVGYNIESYLTFIIDRYENLPEITIFCKNNVIGRHVSKKVFQKCCASQIFTPIEEPGKWEQLSFPVSVTSNDGGYLELNNSWYTKKYPPKYFSNYNNFYSYIFDVTMCPSYLRFAPGANYVVAKENILNRSKIFYINLRSLVSHASLCCEAHYVERSLVAIWSSNISEGIAMKTILDAKALADLEAKCSSELSQKGRFIKMVKSAVFTRFSKLLSQLCSPI